MVERVAVDEVLCLQQRGRDTHVGLKAAWKQHRVFKPHKGREAALHVAVHLHVPAHQARRRSPRRLRWPSRALLCQTQIVVAAKADDLSIPEAIAKSPSLCRCWTATRERSFMLSLERSPKPLVEGVVARRGRRNSWSHERLSNRSRAGVARCPP